MDQKDWLTAIELLVPQIYLPDSELLDLLRSCVPEQGISSMAEAQALLLRNFRARGCNLLQCSQHSLGHRDCAQCCRDRALRK